MRDKSKFILFIICFIIFASSAGAQLSLSELYITPFRLDRGGRPLGLGGAFAGAADDVNASFYNPGGLPWAKGITLNYQNFSNVSANQAYPTGFGQTYGIGFLRSSVTGLPVPASTQEAYFSDTILLLSFGGKASALPYLGSNKIAQNLGVGLNLKYLASQTLGQTDLTEFTSSGLEMDAGLIYHPNRWLSLGGAFCNFLPQSGSLGTLRWSDGRTEGAPLYSKWGLAAKVAGDIWSPLYWENRELLVCSDLEISRVLPPSLSLGAEFNQGGWFYLRGGAFAHPRHGGLSLGSGLRSGSVGIDLTYYSESLRPAQIFLMSIMYFPEEWTFVKRPEEYYPPIRIADPVYDLSPADDFDTYEDSILIKGKAKPGVEVYINDRPSIVDENQSFSVQVPLNTAKNLILIDCFYEGGKLSLERKVFKRAKVVISEEKALLKESQLAKTSLQRRQIEEKQKLLERRKEKVENLVTMGVVEVAPKAAFSLEAPATRGELITWLVKAANLPLPRITYDLFRDVPATHPQAPFIKAAVDRGLIKGFADGTFRPDQPVSVEEGQIIFRKFGVIR
jgi:hypothetical protein